MCENYSVSFQVGSKETYRYKLQNNCVEFIHCIILERLKVYDNINPKEIKVKQIHNLEKYYSNPNEYDDFSVRVLVVSNIEVESLLR